MQYSIQPALIPLPFAANAGVGYINTIPEASQIGIKAAAASLNDGFPPLTMTDPEAGGIPPFGQDMNGILYLISSGSRWNNAGGRYTFNSTFATDSNVGGYPKGAELLMADGTGYWVNQADNNTTNPDTGGAGWVPGFNYGIAIIAMTNANVTLAPAQYAKEIIIITGTLTANLNLVFPTILDQWTVINNTVGAYTVTCKTASGTGVSVLQGGGAGHALYGDGTNINSAIGNQLQNVSSVAALRAMTGAAGQRIYLTGFAADNDGGDGVFQWNASFSGSDDGGCFIVPTGLIGNGCWQRRLSGIVTPMMYGADGTGATNSDTAVNACLAAWGSFEIPAGITIALGNSITLSSTTPGVYATIVGHGRTSKMQFNHNNPGILLNQFVSVVGVALSYGTSYRGEALKPIGRMERGSYFDQIYLSNVTNGFSSKNFLNSAATTISAITWSGGIATATVTNHGMAVGSVAAIAGCTPSGYNNASATLTAVTSNTFSWAVASNPGTYTANSGTVTQQTQWGYSVYVGTIVVENYTGYALYLVDQGATGCVFANTYINNTGYSTTVNGGVYISGSWDTLNFVQLNVEHSYLDGNGAVDNNGCNNLLIGSLHIEANTFTASYTGGYMQMSSVANCRIGALTMYNNTYASTITAHVAAVRGEYGSVRIGSIYCSANTNSTTGGTIDFWGRYTNSTATSMDLRIDTPVASFDIFTGEYLPVPSNNNRINRSYKEVTANAVVSGSTTAGTITYTNTECRSEINGRNLSFRLTATWSAIGAGAGNLQVGGLPYAMAGTANTFYAAAISASGFAFTGQLVAQGVPGTSFFTIYSLSSAGTLTAVAIPTAGTVTLSGVVEI